LVQHKWFQHTTKKFFVVALLFLQMLTDDAMHI